MLTQKLIHIIIFRHTEILFVYECIDIVGGHRTLSFSPGVLNLFSVKYP